MAINYPATLPVPQTSVITPLERRALSNEDAPLEARARSRDRLQFERVTWTLTDAECEIFRAWWKADLTDGAAWFNAAWPVLEGIVDRQRCFRTQPAYAFIPGGFWKVSAILEIRGRGRRVDFGLPIPTTPSRPWNSTNEVGSVTFSDGDFTASIFPEGGGLCVSLDVAEGGLGDGLYYAEMVVTISEPEVGAASVAFGVTRDNPGGSLTGASISTNGIVNVEGSDVDSTSTIVTGDVVMIALNALTGHVYFGLNGMWLDSSDPVSNVGGYALAPGLADYCLFFGYEGDGFSSYACDLRTGVDRLEFAVPNGFTAWAVQGN
jgi:hypothetical protein